MCAVRPPSATGGARVSAQSPVVDAPEQRSKARGYLEWALDCTAALGGSLLVTSVAGCHPGRELGTILHLELPQDARDMSLDRFARQEQRARDVRVAGATRDEIRDLPLAVAQAREVSARSCAGAASPRPDAQPAQELVDMPTPNVANTSQQPFDLRTRLHPRPRTGSPHSFLPGRFIGTRQREKAAFDCLHARSPRRTPSGGAVARGEHDRLTRR